MTAANALERFLSAHERLDDPAVFISRVADGDLRAAVEVIEARPAADVPLRGLSFAVKDNIDVAGMPTTAGCPAFSYQPRESATAVRLLTEAGALLVGKTNMDQFATGLVGTRSPYGVPRNPLDARHVPGGSSSGSAVAVASDVVDFALGTDTAGSGRVPAAFCGIVGVKPTVGSVSTRGVVPAVRSIDCVSIFARDLDLGARVLEVVAAFDADDPFSRHPHVSAGRRGFGDLRFAVIEPSSLTEWQADDQTVDAYRTLVTELRSRTGLVEVVDFGPLAAIGDLLYDGPFVAERAAAVGAFIEAHPDAVDATVGSIITRGFNYSAIDAYNASYRLAALRRKADAAMADVDVLVLPTTPHHPKLTEVAADPISVNSLLGRFTTFANLADYCAISIPHGNHAPSGLRAGATLYGKAWTEPNLFEAAHVLSGADGRGRADLAASDRPSGPAAARLVVAGAHLRGQALEWQLTNLGAEWESTTRTADGYRLYALAGSPPAKPGLVFTGDGTKIEVDVWRLSPDALGRFLQQVPAPLALGTVLLDDGSELTGFVCEPRALEGAVDITHHGGWRRYLAERGT